MYNFKRIPLDLTRELMISYTTSILSHHLCKMLKYLWVGVKRKKIEMCVIMHLFSVEIYFSRLVFQTSILTLTFWFWSGHFRFSTFLIHIDKFQVFYLRPNWWIIHENMYDRNLQSWFLLRLKRFLNQNNFHLDNDDNLFRFCLSFS